MSRAKGSISNKILSTKSNANNNNGIQRIDVIIENKTRTIMLIFTHRFIFEPMDIVILFLRQIYIRKTNVFENFVFFKFKKRRQKMAAIKDLFVWGADFFLDEARTKKIGYVGVKSTSKSHQLILRLFDSNAGAIPKQIRILNHEENEYIYFKQDDRFSEIEKKEYFSLMNAVNDFVTEVFGPVFFEKKRLDFS